MSDFVRDNSKLISDTVEDKSIVPKSHPIVKSSRSSGSIKKGKFNAFHGMPNRPKKLVEGAGSRRFEGGMFSVLYWLPKKMGDYCLLTPFGLETCS